jgi:hypothetical protein
MIVGCYTLHLYCDARATPGCIAVRESGLDQPFQATGQNFRDCQEQARHSGWRLSIVRDTAVCPACAAAGIRPFDIEPSLPGAALSDAPEGGDHNNGSKET